MIANTDLQFLGRAGVNYLQSPGGETGVSGWSLFTTTWSSDVPTTISAGAGNCALLPNKTNPLRGSFSTQFQVNFAGGSAGQGFISDVFTIDNADLAKVLTAAFDYNFNLNGSNVNVSGTSTQTLEIWVYNVGLATWTQPAGYRGINQNSGPGYVAATFQTDSSNASNKNQYRLAVIIKNAPAGPFNMQIDQATVGPQTVQYGAPVTDWQAFTPTGGWTTNTTYTGKWRRVGDTFEAVGRVLLSGPPNAATLTINLPFGLNIDTAKLGSTVGGANDLGVATGEDATVRNYQKFAVDYNGSATSVRLVATSVSGSNLAGGPVTNTVPFGWDVNDNIYFRFQVPILGWSSTVQMSNDTDTRVVAFRAYNYSAAIVAASGANTQATGFSTVDIDTHGTFSSGASSYTIPVSGRYKVACTVAFSAGAGAIAAAIRARLYVDGVYAGDVGFNDTVPTVYNSATIWANGSVEFTFKAGQVLTFYAFQNTGANKTLAIFDWSVSRLSGPSAIAATESVGARYSKNGTQALAGPGEIKITSFTKQWDTHGAWDSTNNFYRFPVSGKYLLTFTGNITSNGTLIVSYKINGGTIIYMGGGYPDRSGCSAILNVNAGDYVELWVYAAAAYTLQTGDQNTFFCIQRLGN